MARKLISSGSHFEADIGYSRAVVDGDWVFVSGTTGFDYATMTIADDVVAQCRQAMRNIAAALRKPMRPSPTSCACTSSCRGARTSSPAGRC